MEFRCSNASFIRGPARSSAPFALAISAIPSEPFIARRPPRPASGFTMTPIRRSMVLSKIH